VGKNIGHTHADNMVELGYLLRPEELHVENTIKDKSSIQSLVNRLGPKEAIQLLGDLMTNSSLLVVTPSSKTPVPQNTFYFSGGFTTQNYKDNIDVIQVEIPKDMRYDQNNRTEFINTLGYSLIKLLDKHYLHQSSKL
jgi:hypothetical protein